MALHTVSLIESQEEAGSSNVNLKVRNLSASRHIGVIPLHDMSR
jgi:hypothetical protein